MTTLMTMPAIPWRTQDLLASSPHTAGPCPHTSTTSTSPGWASFMAACTSSFKAVNWTPSRPGWFSFSTTWNSLQ